ncbi:hypothetical protein BB560_006151 [Smittium megazygosporum]|uniref:Uncharacterized protein n=1 Tax=Smittium megazygosporum TaxID=133381 RepID=A0A2T9YFA9_9FUNG|nr:hypothetical protein BB560_006151 [Smittium megazygosporum]
MLAFAWDYPNEGRQTYCKRSSNGLLLKRLGLTLKILLLLKKKDTYYWAVAFILEKCKKFVYFFSAKIHPSFEITHINYIIDSKYDLKPHHRLHEEKELARCDPQPSPCD